MIKDISIYKFFISKEMKNLLRKIAGYNFYINTDFGLQFRCMNKLSPLFPPHQDLVDERTLVMIIYLTPGWSLKNGGELVLMKSKRSFVKNTFIVNPEYNSAVFFWAEKSHIHMVKKVIEGTRYSIVGEWFINKKIKGKNETYL